jgi:hypothetical protein
MANWFQNIFGNSKRNSSSAYEIPKPESRPTQLPPENDRAAEMPEGGPQLQSFELQVSPQEFRFALGRDGDSLIAYIPQNSSKCVTYIIPLKSFSKIEQAFATLHFLLEKHKIFNTPMHMPEKVFKADTRNVPSMHLRFRYTKRIWQSWYLTHEIPRHIQVFFGDCYLLAAKVTSDQKQQFSERPGIRSRY